MVAEENVAPLEDRKLVLEPLLPDQELLLSIREAKTSEQIKKLMQKVLPYHSANHDVTFSFMSAYELWLEGNDDAFDSVFEKMENPLVNDVVYENTLSNIQLLINPFHDWQAEAEKLLEEEIREK